MARDLVEAAVLAVLSRDDARGQGYTAATIAARVCGAPQDPLQAAEQRAVAEAVIACLMAQGSLEIAGYLHLQGGSVPRYKLATAYPQTGDLRPHGLSP